LNTLFCSSRLKLGLSFRGVIKAIDRIMEDICAKLTSGVDSMNVCKPSRMSGTRVTAVVP
ncbi:hypothetical protein CP03DC29_0067B, partial [Chlamydia psittaci 03DC29]